jgi:hypothetical protein
VNQTCDLTLPRAPLFERCHIQVSAGAHTTLTEVFVIFLSHLGTFLGSAFKNYATVASSHVLTNYFAILHYFDVIYSGLVTAS